MTTAADLVRFLKGKSPQQFQPMSPENFPDPVKAKYIAYQKLTKEERMADMQKFMASAQPAIDAAWAKGSCSKAEMEQVVYNLCPF